MRGLVTIFLWGEARPGGHTLPVSANARRLEIKRESNRNRRLNRNFFASRPEETVRKGVGGGSDGKVVVG